MKRFIIPILMFSGVKDVKAQVPVVKASESTNQRSRRKGELFVLWGWNRDAFTTSTLHLKGVDYDLTLHDMKAHDKLSQISYHNYLQPDRVTIPQTNLRLGYFIKERTALTFGIDHMKYIMTQNQTINVTGNISRNGPYKGELNGPMVITEDFLTFEHTDGLNLVNVGVENYANFHHSKNSKFIIDGLVGAELGVMIPKTNAKLLDYERNDQFHVSGFGAQLKAGIGFTFFRHILIKSELKGGYINMSDIILHQDKNQGRGSQGFFFMQANVMIGVVFKISNKGK